MISYSEEEKFNIKNRQGKSDKVLIKFLIPIHSSFIPVLFCLFSGFLSNCFSLSSHFSFVASLSFFRFPPSFLFFFPPPFLGFPFVSYFPHLFKSSRFIALTSRCFVSHGVHRPSWADSLGSLTPEIREKTRLDTWQP